MSDDAQKHWQAPVGPVDPDHPECASVIAEQAWMTAGGAATGVHPWGVSAGSFAGPVPERWMTDSSVPR